MKSQVFTAASALAAVAVLGLSGCGTPTEAAAPRETIAQLDQPNYVTQPPVTPAPTTAAPVDSAGQVTTTEITYTVQPNDSVGTIAKKFGISAQDLADYNGWPSANQVIHPNEVIKIPKGATIPSSSGGASSGGSTSESSTDSSDPNATTVPGQGCTYTVKAGDNPSKVAKKVGISVEELEAANDAAVYKKFLVGAKLEIPPPGKC